MQKFGRLVLFTLIGLLVFAAVALLGMNLYVQSQGTQARIQQEIRHHFGADLKIERVSVTPWGGLKLSGITIPQTNEPGAPTFLDAKSLGLQLRLLSLFSHRPVVTAIVLVDPKVSWQQDTEGKWKLPGARELPIQTPPEQEDLAESSSSPVTLSPTPLPNEPMATNSATAVSPTEKPGKHLAAEIRRFNMQHGNFRFLDRSGRLVAAFENVGLHSVMRNPSSLRGRATISQISVRDRVFVRQLTTPLRYESGELEFAQIAAELGDGQITGHFALQSETQDSPFSVEAKFRNVDASHLITDAGGAAGILEGKLEGDFQANGRTADANSLTGSGQVVLRQGQVRQYPLLVAVGQMLQIDELTQLRFDEAVAKYHIAPDVVTLDQLKVRSPEIQLSATGTIGFSGKLHLDSRLSISEKLYARLYKPIRVNFQPSDETGFYGIDFQVTGTIDRPKNNLLEKAVGGGLKDLINTIWHGKPERPKKRKSGEPSSADTASPVPQEAVRPAPP